MKILDAQKIREADAYTIKYEPIDSINLMERAAWQCAEWIFRQDYKERHFKIFAGPGNNGGDGLALARILADAEYEVEVFVLKITDNFSEDFTLNYERLEGLSKVNISFIETEEHFPQLDKHVVCIDALFGSGLSRPLQKLPAQLVAYLNSLELTVVAIDIPSGLFGEDNHAPFQHIEDEKPIIKADYTLTFEFPFLSFFLPENDIYVGKPQVMKIGIHPDFIEKVATKYETLEEEHIVPLFRKRAKFAHKGTFGHALLFAGSYGKMGASILASRAALRSGLGLLTVHFPKLGYDIMQTAVPEAMASIDPHDYHVSETPASCDFSAVAFGPGIGQKNASQKALLELIENCKKPLVIDADGLNILAQNPDFIKKLPEKTILTPHPKEFERLFGKANGGHGRLQLQGRLAQELNIIIIQKGAHTTVALPNGKCYFNTTGNPGMATAGSGDTLTGIIVSLLAQGYEACHAAMIGVYAHGLAGDIAAQKVGKTALIAQDIIDNLGEAFKTFENKL